MQHFRVLLLDQRGTGRSSAVTVATLTRRGRPQQQAEYLTHFRWVLVICHMSLQFGVQPLP